MKSPRPVLAVVQGVFAFVATIFFLQQFMSFSAGEATVFGALLGTAASWATLLLLYGIFRWVLHAATSDERRSGRTKD